MPRVVEVPTDLAGALRKVGAMPVFAKPQFGLMKKYVVDIGETKSPETRARYPQPSQNSGSVFYQKQGDRGAPAGGGPGAK